MTPGGHSSNGESRLDRIERMLEFVSNDIVRMQAAQSKRDEENAEAFKQLQAGQRKTGENLQRFAEEFHEQHQNFLQEHQLLLKAQVVLTDRVDRNAVSIQELREAQKHTDERLNALIAVVDGVVRRPPAQ